MRRAIVTTILVALIAGAFTAPSADAGKKRYKRKASSDYVLPSYGQGDVGYGCSFALENCARFATGAKDKFVKMKVVDESGNTVYFDVGQPDGPDDDTFTEDVGSGCGKSGKMAIPVPGQELIVYVPVVGPVLTGSCPGPATRGTVKAIFTDR